MTTTASNLPQKFVSILTAEIFRREGMKFFTEIKNERTRRSVARRWFAKAEEATAHAATFNAEKTNPELFAVAFEAKHVLIPNA